MTSPPRTPVKVPNRRVVMGQVIEVEESYAREVGVPPFVLIPVLVAASVVDILGLLLQAALGALLIGLVVMSGVGAFR